MGARTSFTQFANARAYRELNRSFVEQAMRGKGITSVVDLGCEAGTTTQLIAENLPERGTVIGIDPSGPALRRAKTNLRRFDRLVVRFVEGNAEEVAGIVEEPVDAVFFLNAIHLVEDKDRVLREIFRILKPGGVFVFNTTFFLGAEPQETQQFYRACLFKAFRRLKRTYNLAPQRERAAARVGLTAEEYRKALEDAGFVLSRLQTVNVDLPLKACLAMTRFEDFIRGTLPGIPLEIGCAALEKSVVETFEALNMNVLARNWLLVEAMRR